MKNKTLKNMEKAVIMIMAKGYDWIAANDIAIMCFDNCKANNNIFPVEWYIDKIISKEQYDHEYQTTA